MPCPCFVPDQPLQEPLWQGRLRPPLGRFFRGLCLADPHAPVSLEDAEELAICNLGYARGRCSRFPTEGHADSLNFAIQRKTGCVVVVRYAFEHQLRPISAGTVTYDRERRGLRGCAADDSFAAQVKAFVESCSGAREARQVDSPESV